MAKLTEIISAASQGEWKVLDRGTSVGTTTEDICYAFSPREPRFTPNSVSNSRFIATFDPQHIALMEAIVRTASGSLFSLKTDGEIIDELINLVEALDDYRKERGLL